MVYLIQLVTHPVVLFGTFVFLLLLSLRPLYGWFSKHRNYAELTKMIPEPKRPNTIAGLFGHDSLLTGDMKYIAFIRSLVHLGKTVRLIFGMEPVVIATHPETAKEILARADPKDNKVWQFVKNWLGEGLLTSDGAKWFRNRKLLTHAFHFNTLKAYVPLIRSCLYEHMDMWEQKSKQSDDGSIDIVEGMKSSTLNCLIATAFGNATLSKSEKETFREATETVLELWLKRVSYLPHYIDLIYNLSSDGRLFHKSVAILRKLNKKVLEGAKESVKLGYKNNYKTFVELMIEAKDSEGNGLTDEEMMDEINTFMFAGFDTTGSAIPYCVYYLAKYPDYQEKCREEMTAVLGDKEDITWNDLTQLTYMAMCIKESLRLAGPVLLAYRKMGKDISLSDGQSVPQGVNTGVYLEAIHHSEENWKDPEKYNPERFSPENADKRHSHAFLAFSAGPRNCIGQNFAMMEMKMFLTLALRRFHLTLDEKKLLVMNAPLLRGAEGGIWIKLTPH